MLGTGKSSQTSCLLVLQGSSYHLYSPFLSNRAVQASFPKPSARTVPSGWPGAQLLNCNMENSIMYISLVTVLEFHSEAGEVK